MNPKFGYNKKEGGGNNKLSEQTKKLISRNHKRISGKENGRSLKILLLNTNEIFDCIAEHHESIISVLRISHYV